MNTNYPQTKVKETEEKQQDMRQLVSHKLILPILFVLIISVMLTSCSIKPDIPDPVEQTAKPITYTNTKNEDDVYSIDFPDDWVMGDKKGKKINEKIVTHKDTGSEIGITVEDFYPEIVNFTQDTIAAQCEKKGKTLTKFNQQKSNIFDYSVSYTKNSGEESEASMFELCRICFSLKKVYKIYYRAEEKYYDAFLDIFNHCLDSFSPTTEYTDEMTYYDLWGIDENIDMAYFNDVGISCEYPISWSVSPFDGGATFKSDSGYSVITFSYSEKIDDFAKIDEYDYYDYMQAKIPGISLTSFNNTGDNIVGELAYAEENVQYYVYNTFFDLDNTTIIITFVCPTTYAKQETIALNQFINGLRSW